MENMELEALYLDGEVLNIQLPASVELTVTATVPGVKGDSATNVMKPATMNTGIEVTVPLFIKEGDRVKVDTRTGEYIGRV
jgi:elongation factor P